MSINSVLKVFIISLTLLPDTFKIVVNSSNLILLKSKLSILSWISCVIVVNVGFIYNKLQSFLAKVAPEGQPATAPATATAPAPASEIK